MIDMCITILELLLIAIHLVYYFQPRPWAEQNGEAEWNGTTSPRKEFNPTGR